MYVMHGEVLLGRTGSGGTRWLDHDRGLSRLRHWTHGTWGCRSRYLVCGPMSVIDRVPEVGTIGTYGTCKLLREGRSRHRFWLLWG